MPSSRAASISIYAVPSASRHDRNYEMLSMEVNTAWKRDEQKHAFDAPVGSMDDLRFADVHEPGDESLDLSWLLRPGDSVLHVGTAGSNMKLLPEQRRSLLMKHFQGGHMFYTWDESRKSLRDWVERLTASARSIRRSRSHSSGSPIPAPRAAKEPPALDPHRVTSSDPPGDARTLPECRRF